MYLFMKKENDLCKWYGHFRCWLKEGGVYDINMEH